MVKYNYFEKLEQISALAEEAVKLACGGGEAESISKVRKSCDRLICELEDALFSDFLPPLDRDNIAGCAHSLSRVVDQASELYCNGAFLSMNSKQNEEGRICIRLAEELNSAISMLRRIRKPDELPNVQGYRRLLCEGRSAHTNMLTRLHTGILPRSCAQAIIQTGKLRTELSRCFDELIEIMLNNI